MPNQSLMKKYYGMLKTLHARILITVEDMKIVTNIQEKSVVVLSGIEIVELNITTREIVLINTGTLLVSLKRMSSNRVN